MSAYVKTRRVGGSLMVTVPKEVIDGLGIGENELVKIDVERARPSYFGKFKGIQQMTEEDRLDYDRA